MPSAPKWSQPAARQSRHPASGSTNGPKLRTWPFVAAFRGRRQHRVTVHRPAGQAGVEACGCLSVTWGSPGRPAGVLGADQRQAAQGHQGVFRDTGIVAVRAASRESGHGRISGQTAAPRCIPGHAPTTCRPHPAFGRRRNGQARRRVGRWVRGASRGPRRGRRMALSSSRRWTR